MRNVLVALLFLVPAMSGCVSGDGAGGPTWFGGKDHGLQPTDHPMPFGGDHDHADPDQHRFATNAELLDYDDLRRFGYDPAGLEVGAHAIDIHEDRMVVGVFGSFNDQGGQHGFHLFDISDPENLEHLAYFTPGRPVNGDRTVAFSPDGSVVFLGVERGDRPGVTAVDVSDPTNVHELDYWSDLCAENPFPRPEQAPLWRSSAGCYGPHTLTVGEISGQTYVFVINVGVTILRYDATGFTEVTRYHSVERLTVLDAASQLDPEEIEPPGAIDPAGTTAYRYAYHTAYAHDVWFYQDPLTEKPLLLVAYAFEGVKVLDVSNPQLPILQTSWVPDSNLGINHYVHAFTAERLETGEFILVAGTEAAYAEHEAAPSPLWILDGTDMIEAQPMEVPMELLATWENPDGTPAGGLLNSMHWHRQQDGLLYVSHYHGGVFVFDLRTDADRGRPEHFAHIMPLQADALVAPEWCCHGEAGAPMVFDVAVDSKGFVYTADVVQGVTSVSIQVPEPGLA